MISSALLSPSQRFMISPALPDLADALGVSRSTIGLINGAVAIPGIFLAIFIGWIADREGIREELGLADGAAYRTWLVLIRYVVPVAVAAIFVAGVFG